MKLAINLKMMQLTTGGVGLQGVCSDTSVTYPTDTTREFSALPDVCSGWELYSHYENGTEIEAVTTANIKFQCFTAAGLEVTK